MTERRSLSAGLNVVPDADPEAVRAFVSQERPQPTREPVALTPVSESIDETLRSVAPLERIRKQRRVKPAGIRPVGLIPVTVRLRPEIAGALKRASLEKQLAGDDCFTQQEIVENLLEPWLRTNGYMQ